MIVNIENVIAWFRKVHYPIVEKKDSSLRLTCFRRVKTMQKKVVVLVDDRDGSVAKQTISFAFKGVSYEIDLSDQNAEQFERDIEPWISAARRVGGRLNSRRSTPCGDAEAKSVRVRRWAREKGIELSDRGRIPSAIVEQFEKENR